ncbi:MAG: hypothetical protein LCH99_24465 [Proteobacteria bacterium]|nr:hypothetical protein [Pseudomonadota bacterium]
MTPTQKDGKWFVESRAQEVAGPFDTNAEAWRWIDRHQGETLSKAEDRAEWAFKQSAGGRS